MHLNLFLVKLAKQEQSICIRDGHHYAAQAFI